MFKNSLFGALVFSMVVLACSCKKNKELESDVPEEKKTIKDIQLFTLLNTSDTKVNFENTVREDAFMNQLTYEYYYNGGGVAIADFDNDGLQDLFFTANLVENKLYLNQGNLKFKDITRSAGVSGRRGWRTGVTIVDINNDGYKDIYVCYSGRSPEELRRNALLVNQGNLTFRDMAKEYGLDDSGFSTQAIFFDYDRDNDLDMFLVNHSISKLPDENPRQWKGVKDRFAGDKLYENVEGQFIDVSQKSGIYQNPIGFGLSVSVGDLNQDGWPDIYVTNDYLEDDYLYINNKNGTFSDKLKESIGHTSMYAMGSDIADFNNDGMLDIVALDMVAEDNFRNKTNMSGMNPKAFWYAISEGFHFQYMSNTAQLNMGNGKFSEIAQLLGVSNTDWSWAPLLVDFDNDGHKDLFVTNGYLRDARNKDFRNYRKSFTEKYTQPTQEEVNNILLHLLDTMPSVPLPNYCFRNEGDLKFRNKSAKWGIVEPSFSNGAAYVDLDNDGDLEMVVNNINAPAFIYKNNSKELLKNNHLRIKLRGPKHNRDGIGAKLEITSGETKQLVEKYLTRGYQSSIEDYIHFGLGKVQQLDQLKITWMDGKVEVKENVSTNTVLTLDYDKAKTVDRFVSPVDNAQILFEDITKKLECRYVHKENFYDDFIKESLLPHKMSQFGPAMTVGDVNGDGLEDIYIGGARDQSGSLQIQQADGSFEESVQADFKRDENHEDTGALFFDADKDGDLDLYVVSGGNEAQQGSEYFNDRFYENRDGTFKKRTDILPKNVLSGSCVVPCDFDKDGDLDLFVGGRQVPGRYPSPASSTLLMNESTVDQLKFKDVTAEKAPMLENVGMVTSALWMDMDGDNLDDLIIAGEWMALKILKNNGNQFQDISGNSGLTNEIGWWNTLASGDFDNDGDLDFVGGNLGENYKYKASYDQPFKIYAKDFDRNNTFDIVLGYYQDDNLYPLRGRECSSNQMPFIKKKFKTYDAFAKASLVDVYGKENLETAIQYEAKNFATSYFENLGNGEFRVKPLPTLAQISSVNAIQVNDFDNDGKLDMILAGNLMGSEVETPRNDASYGVFLKGDGKGNFVAQFPYESGLNVKGEVKHIEAINLSNKGGKSFVFAINNNKLVFYTVVSSN